jgi:hypothetical protein
VVLPALSVAEQETVWTPTVLVSTGPQDWVEIPDVASVALGFAVVTWWRWIGAFRTTGLSEGGAASSLNGPAAMPGLQLESASQTWPDGIVTAAPPAEAVRVKVHGIPAAAAQGAVIAEPASLTEKPAVWIPRYQPLLPGSEH